MGSLTSPPHRPDAPRPITAREIHGKLEELLAAVAALAGPAGDESPRPLSPADLLRCLVPLTSRN